MNGDRFSTDQALALRKHYARLAELYSERCVDALLDGRWSAATRWAHAYRLAAQECRALGEQLRDEPVAESVAA